MSAQPRPRVSGVKSLLELDAPDIRLTDLEPEMPGPAVAANENARSPAPEEQAPEASAAEPDVTTRPHTHVPRESWFDVKLDALGALDPRQALAWRYEAAFAAHTLLLPSAPSSEARELLVNVLRGYEKRLRGAAGSPDERTGQSTVALHGLLPPSAVEELTPLLSELEVTLLTVDECVSEDLFRRRFTRKLVEPKLLLQYARFLAAHGFNIGYQRDRFEYLAQELLTTRLPSGKLLLTSRKRASNVLLRLTRGLTRPDAATGLEAPLSYLRDSLDRLQSLTRAQSFFDSGFYVDVCGYKIGKPEHVTSPEFLYLCVAIDVEVHNKLRAWSESAAEGGKQAPGSELGALENQLDAQKDAARAVFTGFHLPLGAVREAKKPVRPARSWSLPGGTLLRLSAAVLLLAVVVGANLFALDVVQLEKPPAIMTPERVALLSPLLLEGQLVENGHRFLGVVARPIWNRMPPRDRQNAADKLAQALKAQGIEHAQVMAYKTRAIEIAFGSVVYVDDARP